MPVGKGKKVAIGVGGTIGVIFVALIALGSALTANAKSLDFTVSTATTNSGMPTNLGNNTTYIYDIDFVNSGSSKYLVKPINFKVITDTESVYNDSPYPVSNQALPYMELEQNHHAKGQLGFTIPKGESPKLLEYSDGTVKISKIIG